MIASALRFHSPIAYPLTLNLFAFYWSSQGFVDSS
jgi:hypothetical protein